MNHFLSLKLYRTLIHSIFRILKVDGSFFIIVIKGAWFSWSPVIFFAVWIILNTWYYWQMTHFGKMFLTFLDSLYILVICFCWIVLKVCFSCGMISLLEAVFHHEWIIDAEWYFHQVILYHTLIVYVLWIIFRRYITLSWFSAIIVLIYPPMDHSLELFIYFAMIPLCLLDIDLAWIIPCFCYLLWLIL